MRIGIIGPGKIAERFAAACRQVEGVTVFAAASSSKERAEAFAEKYHIPHALDSYEKLWEMPEIDAVYISSINSRHYPMAKACLEAKKAVLCEKPMCISPEQARNLVALAKQQQVLLMEGMWTATLPCIQKAAQWIREGRLGTVNYLDSRFSFFYPKETTGRLFDRKLGGGALLDVGIYCLAFTLLMMEQKPVSVRSRLQVGDTGVDEMGAALLQFENGAVANCSFGVQGKAPADAHIYGSQGQICLKEFFCCRKAELYDTAGNLLETEEDPQEDGFVHEIRTFYETWKSKSLEAPGASHRLTLDCAELIDEIFRNAH